MTTGGVFRTSRLNKYQPMLKLYSKNTHTRIPQLMPKEM